MRTLKEIQNNFKNFTYRVQTRYLKEMSLADMMTPEENKEYEKLIKEYIEVVKDRDKNEHTL